LQNVKEVYAFEPFKLTFKLANQNFLYNKELSSKIHPRNYGLGKKEETKEILFNRSNLGLNNIYRRNTNPQKDENLETIDIKNACSEINNILAKQSQNEFIIKIDTEGAEYEILESLFSKKVSEKIVGFMIEWHDLGPEKLEEMLLSENFKLYSFNLKRNTGLIYAIR
jgi:FkbM family methyltransferase